ncbi:MAG: thermonuclease family protein [Smithellaceae bacterium]|nr:thermonuclease family protein [Smithellaceae bacterium]
MTRSKGFLIQFFFFVPAFIILVACTESPVYAKASRTVKGTVTRVYDGDTIQITTLNQTILRVRLYGIDAPETPKTDYQTGQWNMPGQSHGKESAEALKNKILDHKVKLDIIDVDRYRRMVGIIRLENRNINLEMLMEGYADCYIKYLRHPYRKPFLDACRKAKSAKRGIWSLPEYERPQEFRRRFRKQGMD